MNPLKVRLVVLELAGSNSRDQLVAAPAQKKGAPRAKTPRVEIHVDKGALGDLAVGDAIEISVRRPPAKAAKKKATKKAAAPAKAKA